MDILCPISLFGPSIVSQLANFTKKELDVHLMITEPDKFIDKFLQAGADYLSFHIEAKVDHRYWLDKIKENSCKAGIVINPDTPVEKITHLLSDIDYVLVMTVFPGYGGQKYRQECTKKIAELRRLQSEHDFLIEVDGGINSGTAKDVKAAGADILVAGSFIFKNRKKYSETIRSLRNV